MSPRVLRPSRRRNVLRFVLGLALSSFAILGMLTSAPVPLGMLVLAIGLWPLSLAALIAFKRRAYELHLDEHGFRVYDAFGRLTHDVRWSEIVRVMHVGANACSFIVVGWECHPREPKRGRWRWKRGTRNDDGCMPDTYGMKSDKLVDVMMAYAGAGAPTASVAGMPVEPF